MANERKDLKLIEWVARVMFVDTSSQKKSMGAVRLGLARTLFSWFLMLSLLPLSIVGMIEYNNARVNILESRHEELSTVNLMLNRQISDYFDDIVVNVHFRSGKAVDFLSDFRKLTSEQNLSAKEFLDSEGYYQLIDTYSVEFIDLMRFYDYSDVLVGDAEGNIVYSVGRYSDFGENIFTGPLSETVFSKTVREAIAQDDRLYSDQEIYPPAGDEKVSFFVLPLVDDRENTIGFIAAQIWARDDVSFILNQSIGMSNHVKAYVVGEDKRIRFFPEGKNFPEAPLYLEPVNEWKTHFNENGEYVPGHGDDRFDADVHVYDEDIHDEYGGIDHELEEAELDPDSHSDTHISVYRNNENIKVMGVSRNVVVAGVNMLLITEMDYEMAMAPATDFRSQLLFVLGVTSFLVLLIAGVITRRIVNPIRKITQWVNEVASGNFVDGEVLQQKNEIGELSKSFQVMTERLRKVSADNEERNWHQEGVAKLNETLRGEQAISDLCRNIITCLCRYLDIPMGAMYLLVDERRLQMMGSFALTTRKRAGNDFSLGEGIPGQAALERQALTITVPDDYFSIESGLGSHLPDRVYAVPVIYEGKVMAVLEFALQGPLSERSQMFVDASMESLAISMNSSQTRERVQELLHQTTQQTESLQKQQEDLRTANEELEHQTKILQESEEELKSQSDELQRANAELEETSESLFHQKEEIEAKNKEIEDSRKILEQRAQEMEMVSKYKSEFLANMSHELRTPLNSMLILAKMLADNVDGNLDSDEQESAQVIHKVGHDLLNLINDILDLSKVEAGKLSVHMEHVSLDSILESMNNQFKPLAKERKLYFEINRKMNTEVNLQTDSQRVMQILKNLLSNGFKFTEEGGIKLHVEQLPAGSGFKSEALCKHGAISLAVEDSGIGIPKEKQDAIFEAFQQADGSTSRKYGGTGLGLSIAREMSRLLGGEMRITSEEGKGATFSLLLPAQLEALSSQDAQVHEFTSEVAYKVPEHSEATASAEPKAEIEAVQEEVKDEPQEADDDRYDLNGERPVLVVEDDSEFAWVIYRLAKMNGAACLVTGTGKEAIELSLKYHPRAVILDLGLPDMDGKDVLKELKEQKCTEDIPVHVISGRDEDSALRAMGAVDYLIKPVSTQQLTKMFGELRKTAKFEKILLVDPDPDVSKQVNTFIAGQCEVITAETAAEAREQIKNNSFTSIILELDLPDETGDALLESLHQEYGENLPPVIINTSETLDRERYTVLGGESDTMVVKGEVSSQDRLKDEVSLFLNSVSKPVVKHKKPAAKPVTGDEQLKGCKLLLVDDDLRNTFALSKALQRFEMDITIADNGELALEQLENNPDVEVVLMDIMMPVMDGYEATKKIREQERFKNLPVIALTAKAMADDKDKCIQAGASDYLTKPVDIDKLVSMIKVWLQSGAGE
ncbi:response regulator [Parendozoicomonas sp. Alg238-R29]|uniref:response regulator n=1 Tax=Parendozoicomonas sp. Alg238-R29 TaxID=2993446 RepID=UPI00248ED633|nr:response regulator [Parendozoicomonas sp. Alg238-R29]